MGHESMAGFLHNISNLLACMVLGADVRSSHHALRPLILTNVPLAGKLIEYIGFGFKENDPDFDALNEIHLPMNFPIMKRYRSVTDRCSVCNGNIQLCLDNISPRKKTEHVCGQLRYLESTD